MYRLLNNGFLVSAGYVWAQSLFVMSFIGAASGCVQSDSPVAPTTRPQNDEASGNVTATDTDAAKTVSKDGRQSSDSFTIVELKPGEGMLNELLPSEVKKARELGRKPFVELFADWCEPCKAIHDGLNDPVMIDAFRGTYVIRLNSDLWEKQLIEANLLPLVIPVFFELGGDGKPTGRQITGNAWEENVPANMAPPLKSFFNEGN